MEYTGLCVFGFLISLLMIVRAISHHQTGNINHNRCLWLGHEPMARALCLAIFWWYKIVYISYGMCALFWRHIRGMATHQNNLLDSRFVTKKAPLICCSFVKGNPTGASNVQSVSISWSHHGRRNWPTDSSTQTFQLMPYFLKLGIIWQISFQGMLRIAMEKCNRD